MGVFFLLSFRSELANRFLYAWRLRVISVFLHTFILSFVFMLLISSQLYWADDEMT